MKVNAKLLIILACTLVVNLCGCATVPLAPEEMDMKAKNMAPPPDKGVVYLYRDETFGAGVKIGVKLDGRAMGKTAAKTYFMWILDPGMHEVVSEAENTSRLTFYAKPGETSYIWQEVKMGFLYARSKLQFVDQGKGRDGLNECKLIQEQP